MVLSIDVAICAIETNKCEIFVVNTQTLYTFKNSVSH